MSVTRIRAIVVELYVETNQGVMTRKLSTSDEPIDDFQERIRVTLDQMLDRDESPSREQLEQALRDAYRDPMCVSGHVPDCDCGSPPLLRSR